MRVRHLEGGPNTARALGVSTAAGDEVTVSKPIGRRLVQFRFYAPGEECCTERTSDGALCGEDTPCQYHDSDGEG